MVQPGVLVADRFAVEQEIAAGGMGVVYRARDARSDGLVALKLLHAADPETTERFALEARVLAELDHPAIVRYVGHGTAAGGRPWLAMEWLEGEDLSTRLAGAGLEVKDAVTVAVRVAEALAVAHRRGVVHRDIKPSNVFLPGGRIDDAKVLDFGVARLVGGDASGITRTGAIVGTPAYMSPEQARGAGTIDARSDLFSLGAVLFECLTGGPPFQAAHAMAVMAKIVFDDAPRLCDVRPELPPAFDDLVRRLLHKDRAARPPDAASVAAELKRLRPGEGGAAARPSRRVPALTGAENRLCCVVLAARDPAVTGPGALDETAAASGDGRELAELARVAERYGARLEALIDGSVAAVIAGAGVATDLCGRAARYALAVRARRPAARIGLATGRAVMNGELPLGEVIERAAALAAPPAPGAVGSIRVDAVTAGLLAIAFRLEEDGADRVLTAERGDDDADRGRLLGKPTPCVGRDRELRGLEAALAECVDDGVARAVLVTGPPGIGKSRIRFEFLRRLRDQPDAEVWVGAGDPIRAGSPFGLLSQVIRRSCGVPDGAAVAVARAELAARVARDVPEADRPRVAEFLAELCGLAPDDGASPQLLAARENPMLMGDQLRRAWEDHVLGACSARPVVVVLEDLHWGDLPTVTFLDAALRLARERPLLVVAFARPEVHERFPSLWAERPLTEVRLAELSRKASERLVRAALGAVEDRIVQRIVDQAAGNAFYLEELIRAVAEGHGTVLPATLLAMAQARLESLPEEHRRVLRAGSVFGGTFWRGGVTALLGVDPGTPEVLRALVEREVLARERAPRFGGEGEEEVSFRHALLREAAYSMLTDHDRILGHRLAGEWLEAAGERDALVLGEHYERGGEPARAVGWYQRSAEQALEANDLAAVLARTERAARLGAKGRELAALRLLEATAHHWRAEYELGERCATEAMRGLPPLSAPWYRAAEEVAECSLPIGRVHRLVALAEALYPPPAGGEAAAAFVVAAATLEMQLGLSGKQEAAAPLARRLDSAVARLPAPGPQVDARIHFARASRALLGGDTVAALEGARRTTERYDEAGDRRNASLMRTNLAYALSEMGAFEEAVEVSRAALADAERMGLAAVAANARENLALALARRGAFAEAREVVAAAIQAFAATHDARNEGLCRIYLAAVELLAGELEPAEAAARAAVAATAHVPTTRAHALAMLAAVLLARGRAADALAAAEEAAGLLAQLGGIDEGEALVRLTHARALLACERADEARTVAAEAKARLLERAARIHSAEWRRSFLEQVPENAATLALAGDTGEV